MIQAPINNVLVKVEHKYAKHISKVMRLSAIQNNSSVDPSDLVNIVGTITSVPNIVRGGRDYDGFSLQDIRVGDKAIFSYLVIYNLVDLGKNEEPTYKNRIWYENEEFFACDIRNLFAVIRDGEIIMLNGYVMITQFEQSNIYVPASMKRVKGTAKAQVMQIGYPRSNQNKIDVSVGDTVLFNPMIVQKYEINDKKFCIIQQEKILGVEVEV